MNVVVNTATQQSFKVVVSDGVIVPVPGSVVTLKNQVSEIPLNSLGDIPDINFVNLVNGATLIYNESTGQFDVQPVAQLNGGSF